MADLKTRNGAVGTFETVAKWSVAEGQPMASKTGTFSGPADAASLKSFVAALPETTEAAKGGTAKFWADWLYGADLKVKAVLRPAASADSPVLVRDNIAINLATGERLNKKTNAALPALSLDKRVAAINGAFEEAGNLGGEPQAAFIVGRQMLLDAKEVTEANGRIAVAKK